MTLQGLSDDLAGFRIQGSKQTGRAMADIVVRAAFDLSRAHGQQGCGPVQCLNLTLFIHAQDQGTIGRVQIQAHDIAHLVDEQRIFGQLERFAAVGSQGKCAPNTVNRCPTQARPLGQRARGPVGGIGRRGLQG